MHRRIIARCDRRAIAEPSPETETETETETEASTIVKPNITTSHTGRPLTGASQR